MPVWGAEAAAVPPPPRPDTSRTPPRGHYIQLHLLNKPMKEEKEEGQEEEEEEDHRYCMHNEVTAQNDISRKFTVP